MSSDNTRECSQGKTPGQYLYEADVAADPFYHDGTPRKTWHELTGPMQWSWERAAEANTRHDAAPRQEPRANQEAP